MAELILSDDEKAAATWLELDDATVGKLVKKTALDLKEHAGEQGRVWWFSAAMLLVGMAEDSNAHDFSQEVRGFTRDGVSCGDWKVSVTRIKPLH
jgi:hypothetical protein